jgi:hypothetical protein
LGEEGLPLVRALVDSSVARADAELGRLLAGVESLGLSGRTVVVVTSDHGDSLGEYGRAGHTTLADSDLLVPLVIAVPGGRGAGRTISRQVRLVDLWPTVAELLGVTTAEGLDGVSLVPFLDGEPWAGPAEAWSYAPAFNRGVSLRVDGHLVADPDERNDLGAGDPRVEPLAVRARGYLEQNGIDLRVRLANAGPGTLRGRLTGAPVVAQGVTATDLAPGIIRSDVPGEAFFDLAPGSSCTLHLGKVVGHDLAVGGVFDPAEGRPPLSLHFDLEKLERRQAVVLAGGSWRRVRDPLEPVATGLEVWWHGAAGVGEASPATVDPEVRRQLEALGYLD